MVTRRICTRSRRKSVIRTRTPLRSAWLTKRGWHVPRGFYGPFYYYYRIRILYMYIFFFNSKAARVAFFEKPSKVTDFWKKWIAACPIDRSTTRVTLCVFFSKVIGSFLHHDENAVRFCVYFINFSYNVIFSKPPLRLCYTPGPSRNNC